LKDFFSFLLLLLLFFYFFSLLLSVLQVYIFSNSFKDNENTGLEVYPRRCIPTPTKFHGKCIAVKVNFDVRQICAFYPDPRLGDTPTTEEVRYTVYCCSGLVSDTTLELLLDKLSFERVPVEVAQPRLNGEPCEVDMEGVPVILDRERDCDCDSHRAAEGTK